MKHLQGQHRQESHGNRVYAPSRTLLTGGRSRKRTASRPNRAATSSPAQAAQSRLRDKTAAASPRRPATAPAPAPAGAGPQQDVPLRLMDDDVLAREYQTAMAADDEDRIAQIERELDRRDQVDDGEVDEAEAEAFMASLEGKPRSTPMEQAKRAYQDWLHAQTVRAIEATAGTLLNPAGRAAGISDEAMMDGTVNRAQVKKYASEELLRWFAEPGNTRMTQTDFVTQWLGRNSAKTQARINTPLSEF